MDVGDEPVMVEVEMRIGVCRGCVNKAGEVGKAESKGSDVQGRVDIGGFNLRESCEETGVVSEVDDDGDCGSEGGKQICRGDA